MASSITADLPSPTSHDPFTSAAETAESCSDDEEKKDCQAGKDSCTVYLHRLSSNLPDIPDIPSPLMRPPKSGVKSTTTETNAHLPLSAAPAQRNGTGK